MRFRWHFLERRFPLWSGNQFTFLDSAILFRKQATV
jgi:hypothetical protein